MIGFSTASLQFRLAARLAALYVGATAIAAAVLIYQAYGTATSLNDRELSQRADDLGGYCTVGPADPSGVIVLARLPLEVTP